MRSFLQDYEVNQQWMLELKNQTTVYLYDECCGDDPFVTIRYDLIIGRRASFFFFALVFPGCLLNILLIIIFIMPPESEERVSIGKLLSN